MLVLIILCACPERDHVTEEKHILKRLLRGFLDKLELFNYIDDFCLLKSALLT